MAWSSQHSQQAMIALGGVVGLAAGLRPDLLQRAFGIPARDITGANRLGWRLFAARNLYLSAKPSRAMKPRSRHSVSSRCWTSWCSGAPSQTGRCREGQQSSPRRPRRRSSASTGTAATGLALSRRDPPDAPQLVLRDRIAESVLMSWDEPL